MVILRKFGFILVMSLSAAACTQVLGIEDRSLRQTLESDDGGALSSDEASTTSDSSVIIGTKDSGSSVNVPDPARAVFSTSAIDFGLVGCGDTAPASRTLTINNAGDLALDWQATLGPTSSFSIVGMSAGPIAGQSYATLTLASTGFPTFATAGQTGEATLTVVINIAGQPSSSQDFKITATAAGASLSLNPGIAAFGQVQVSSEASPVPVDLRNTGNLPTTVSFGTSTDSQFFLSSDAGTMSLAPGEAVSGLVARFLPATSTASTATISIGASGGPMCGVAPSAIHLTGEGTSGPVTLQPGSLDFGLVSCGKTATSQLVTMSTNGTPFSWSASLGKGASSPYSISPTSGTAAAGTPVVVTVTPHAVPTTSAITPDLYGDNLTIVASDGSHVIPLHETAQGAILSQSTTAVAFGGVNVGTKATSSFDVINDGNASATVSYTSGNAAFAIAPQGQTLGGQGYSSSTTVTFSPSSQIVYAASASMSVSPDTVLCAPLPVALPMSGTGTVSYASVSPSSLDFGLVRCGSTGSSHNVTISNAAASNGPAFNWTATLGKGASSPYALSASSGNLKANKSLTLTVSPSAIPQISPVTSDHYADTLTITTDAANDGAPHVVNLHETAQGVSLALTPSPLSLGNVASGSSASSPFQITNNGNLQAQVFLTVSGTYFTADPLIATVNGGTSVAGAATFHPTKSGLGARTGTVSASFLQTNCGGTVTPLSLTGNGS